MHSEIDNYGYTNVKSRIMMCTFEVKMIVRNYPVK